MDTGLKGKQLHNILERKSFYAMSHNDILIWCVLRHKLKEKLQWRKFECYRQW